MIEFATEHRPIFLAVFILIATWNAGVFVLAALLLRFRYHSTAAYYCYLGVGGLWLTGVAAKVCVFGPSLFRWYVADIGFTLLPLAFFALQFAKRPHLEYQNEPPSHAYRRCLDKFDEAKFLLKITLGLAIGYELLVGYVYWANPDLAVSGAGSTDPIDIVMYVVGAYIGHKLINVMRKPYEAKMLSYEASEKEAKAAIESAKRKARSSPRPNKRAHQKRNRQ